MSNLIFDLSNRTHQTSITIPCGTKKKKTRFFFNSQIGFASNFGSWTMEDLENSTQEYQFDLESSGTSINYSNSTGPRQYRNEELAKIEIAVLSLLFFLALFGNSVVLIVLKLKHTTLTRMQLLIVYLSITDISVALFHILPTTIHKVFFYFPNNISICRVYRFITVVELYASSFVLIITAFDRYISICHPLTAHIWTNKRVHLMTAGAWLIALLCSTPQFNVKLIKYGDGYHCHPNLPKQLDVLAYSWWAFCSVFFIPLVLLIFFYGRICYVVWQSMRGRECIQSISNNTSSRYARKNNKSRISSQTSDNQVKKYSNMHDKNAARNPRAICQGVSKSKIKTIKLTFSVVVCFIACYTPFFTAMLAGSYKSNLIKSESPAMVILSLLPSLNSCTNPWIYLAFSGKDVQYAVDPVLASRTTLRQSQVNSSVFVAMSRTNQRS